LDLQSCGRIDDDAMPILASLPGLRIVDVSAAAMTDAGIAALGKARPDLRIVHADFHPAKPAMPNGPAN
jgi:hypothetical protein